MPIYLRDLHSKQPFTRTRYAANTFTKSKTPCKFSLFFSKKRRKICELTCRFDQRMYCILSGKAEWGTALRSSRGTSSVSILFPTLPADACKIASLVRRSEAPEIWITIRLIVLFERKDQSPKIMKHEKSDSSWNMKNLQSIASYVGPLMSNKTAPKRWYNIKGAFQNVQKEQTVENPICGYWVKT